MLSSARAARWGLWALVLGGAPPLASACFDQTIPSSFVPVPEASPPDVVEAAVVDVVHVDTGSLVGDGATGAFPCGASFCPTPYTCILTYSDAGGQTSQSCVPINGCTAGDCMCVSAIVATAYCAGQHVACTSGRGAVVSCTP